MSDSRPRQRRRFITAAVAALAFPAAATAQTLPCIPQEQAAALVTFALPSLVKGIADRCGPALPRSAFLTANAQMLADRWRADAGYSWAPARAAISGIFRQYLGQEMPPEMDGDLLRTMAEPLLGGLLAKRIDTADCAQVDTAVASIAPLSGRAVGRLVAVGAALADRKDKGLAGVLHICRPARAPMGRPRG